MIQHLNDKKLTMFQMYQNNFDMQYQYVSISVKNFSFYIQIKEENFNARETSYKVHPIAT